MSKHISLGLTITLIALTAAFTFILTSAFNLNRFNSKVSQVETMAEKYDRLNAVDTYVREHYYTGIDEGVLMDSMLKGYVNGLQDPYASYLTPAEYQDLQNSDKGILVGIGISVQKEESGYIMISQITSDTPAAATDLAVGDVVVAVDGEDVLKLGYTEAVAHIRGTEGTSVKLTIRRNGEDKEYDFVRQTIELKSAWGEMLDNHVGYIRITAFKDATVNQFQTALDTLIRDGAQSLVFDLRDNGGGLVTAVQACLDPLLPEGDIAFATYKSGKETVLITSDSKELNLPMAVLINKNTASAAELFASAIRDFNKGSLYGETSFGKGIMQNTVALADGGGLTITVATYRTAHSECYHGVGLKPDYVVDLPEDTPAIDNLPHQDDTQLQKALSVLQAAK